MHFINTIAASLLLAGSALASSGSVVVHVVNVSVRGPNNTLTYSPQNTQAQPGEVVQFQFQNGNHSVAQSTFAKPCIPINNVMSNVTGFFSGFLPVPQPASTIPTYSVLVNNTKPIWFYCAQGKHCEKGMVGAINAPSTGNTIQAFAALAAQVQDTIIPNGGNATGLGSGSTSSSGSATSSASGSSSTMATTASGSGSSSTTTSSSSNVSSGAASANLLASPQQILAGGFVAALLSALL